MSNETKNTCCADGRHVSIQQAYKKEPGEDKRKPVSFTTPIQAVYDGKTGASLEAILAQFNSIYVQYQGTPEATRNIIPKEMRRAGLTITYMDMESNTIMERASSAVQKDNDYWGLDVNWSRVDELSLSRDIAVSANGTWIINGEDTGVKALGPKGDTGLTPWLKTIDNRLHFSYDNVTWEPCSENIAAWFRFSATSSDSQAGTIGRIQISRDNKTWTDLSPEFRNYLRIQSYVATTSALPKNQVVGTIYGVGPTYAADDTAHTNPIYRLHVWNGTSWVDNGKFTSIAAGVVQETGDSETEVMSQKAVTEKISELGSTVQSIDLDVSMTLAPKRDIKDIANGGTWNVNSKRLAIQANILSGKKYTVEVLFNQSNRFRIYTSSSSTGEVIDNIINLDSFKSNYSADFIATSDAAYIIAEVLNHTTLPDSGSIIVKYWHFTSKFDEVIRFDDKPKYDSNNLLSSGTVYKELEPINKVLGITSNKITVANGGVWFESANRLYIDVNIRKGYVYDVYVEFNSPSYYRAYTADYYNSSDFKDTIVRPAIKIESDFFSFVASEDSKVLICSVLNANPMPTSGTIKIIEHNYESNINEKHKTLVCWGDSLTQGVGGNGVSITSVIKELSRNKWDVLNMGIGGESTLRILNRIGTKQIHLKGINTDGSITLPSDGSEVEVSRMCHINNDGTYTTILNLGEKGISPFILDGIECACRFDMSNENKMFIRRIESSDSDYTTIPYPTIYTLAQGQYRKADAVIIYMGRNGEWKYDPDSLIKQFDEAISFVNTKDYLLAVGTHDSLNSEIISVREELERKMEIKYGVKFVNVRKYLITKALQDADITPSAVDNEQITHGNCPPSLLINDNIHFNETGYRLLGELFYNHFKYIGVNI